MKSRVSQIISTGLAWIVLLSLIAGVGYLLWMGVPWLLQEVGALYGQADPEFRLGLITAVLSTAGVVWSVIYQRRRELDNLRFERKREAYGAFFDILFDFLKSSESGTDPVNDETVKDKFRDLTKRLMIWGSPTSINAYNKFQSDIAGTSDDIRETFARVETLLRQFRADLGHHDKRLGRFALTKLILKGDEHHKLDSVLPLS